MLFLDDACNASGLSTCYGKPTVRPLPYNQFGDRPGGLLMTTRMNRGRNRSFILIRYGDVRSLAGTIKQLTVPADVAGRFPLGKAAPGDITPTGATTRPAQQAGEPWNGDAVSRQRGFQAHVFDRIARAAHRSTGRNLTDGLVASRVILAALRFVASSEKDPPQIRAELFDPSWQTDFGRLGGTTGIRGYGVNGSAGHARIIPASIKNELLKEVYALAFSGA